MLGMACLSTCLRPSAAHDKPKPFGSRRASRGPANLGEGARAATRARASVL